MDSVDILNSQAVVIFLTITLPGIGWLAKYLLDRHKENKKKIRKYAYTQALQDVANVYSAMESIKSLDGVHRVLLLEVSNGGHRPKPGSVLYARAIEIKLTDIENRSTRLSSYQQLRLDEHYINMCINVQTHGVYKVNIKDESPSMLQQLYITEGIPYAEVYHIYTDEHREKMFILSIATYDEHHIDFPILNTRANINTKITEIQNYFAKYQSRH